MKIYRIFMYDFVASPPLDTLQSQRDIPTDTTIQIKKHIISLLL